MRVLALALVAPLARKMSKKIMLFLQVSIYLPQLRVPFVF